MQAPTTPSGSPAQEPVERTCPGCGAANGMTSAFCWQCYRPFGSHEPMSRAQASPAPPAIRAQAPVGVPGAPPDATWMPPATSGQYVGPRAPQAWRPPPVATTAPPRRIGSMLGVIVLALAVAAGAAFVFLRPSGDVELPSGFGDLTKIDNDQTQQVVDSFVQELEAIDVEGDMAMYGSGTPTAALMWIRDASVPTTDAAFDEFASGFDSGIGSDAALDRTRRTSEVIDGVTFVCAPVVSVAPGSICMWQDEGIFWLLFDFSGNRLQAGQDLAVVASGVVDSD